MVSEVFAHRYLLVARGEMCNHTMEKLDNILTEYVKLTSPAR